MEITGTPQEKQIIVDMCDVTLKAGGLKNLQAVQDVLKSIKPGPEVKNEHAKTTGSVGKSENEVKKGK